jgi:GNAT superfamily N-acetyltransferase
MHIHQATALDDIAIIRTLFQEYAAWLKVDLCFQHFAEELASLPGAYAPPKGRLLLATAADGPAACIALRPLDDPFGVLASTGQCCCEIKRLYVRPPYRRHGLGRTLAARIISDASEIGYSRMFLDTLSSMEPAIRLYETLGFVRCPKYYDTPLRETVFMELIL